MVGGGGGVGGGQVGGERNCILIFGTLIVYMVCRLQQQYHLGVKGQRQYILDSKRNAYYPISI